MDIKKLHEIYEEAYIVANIWETYGGSFLKGLSEALAHADYGNMIKIKIAFIDEWEDALLKADTIKNKQKGKKCVK